jgi:hypothetical protein
MSEKSFQTNCAVCGCKVALAAPYPITVITVCEPCFVKRTKDVADVITRTPGNVTVHVADAIGRATDAV